MDKIDFVRTLGEDETLNLGSSQLFILGPVQTPDSDFDFQSNLANFHKSDDEGDDDAGDDAGGNYEKDDFFDSISCEATDRQSGVDNRLRGREERDLNTETFGAVALSQRRRRGGRGGRGGRGRYE